MIGMRPALAALILVALIHPQNVQAQRLPAASTIQRAEALMFSPCTEPAHRMESARSFYP